jgi:hypothetical protein
VDTATGEFGERRRTHREEAEQFYGTLKEQSVRVGMEASGHGRWFQRLLSELHFELWIGSARTFVRLSSLTSIVLGDGLISWGSASTHFPWADTARRRRRRASNSHDSVCS